MPIILFHVQTQQKIGRGFGLHTQMGMHNAFGPASRARRIGDQEWILGFDRNSREIRAGVAHGFSPVQIAGRIGNRSAEPTQAKHRVDRRHLIQRLGQRRLHPDRLAPSGAGIRRQHCNSIGIVQARDDGRG